MSSLKSAFKEVSEKTFTIKDDHKVYEATLIFGKTTKDWDTDTDWVPNENKYAAYIITPRGKPNYRSKVWVSKDNMEKELSFIKGEVSIREILSNPSFKVF